MIEFIQGKVEEKTPATVVLEVGGIGYLLSISLNTYNSLKQGEVARLLVHEVLREDTHDLYGFFTEGERSLFRLLITVNGVGPATARLMLSSHTPQELSLHIAEGREEMLKATKGIGTRTAQRIIVELKDKVLQEMGQWLDGGAAATAQTDLVAHQEQYDEAVRAFVALGYPQSAARKVVAKLVQTDPNMAINDMIRQGLRMF